MNLAVAAVQTGPYAGNFAAQMAMVEEAAMAAVRACRPRVLLLPELVSTPYFCTLERPEFFGRYAEPIPGPTTEVLARIARAADGYVIASLFERRGQDHHNTAAVITPAGELLGTYSKTHIPFIEVPGTWTNEKYYFKPGGELATFDLGGVTAGVLICYDRSFPEAWRTLVLRGAEVVFVTASSSGFRFEAFIRELQVRAMESGVWVVAANKAGDEQMAEEVEPKHFYGRSCIIDPTGKVVSSLGDEPGGHLGATLDMARVGEARSRLNYLRDRRPDLYGPLVGAPSVER
ncbi:MAG TPA: carbon-nitrogen hydrolase family protein [Symbiobacteriaceae bacterium]|jgi:N-carbamoylputrescine amidase